MNNRENILEKNSQAAMSPMDVLAWKCLDS